MTVQCLFLKEEKDICLTQNKCVHNYSVPVFFLLNRFLTRLGKVLLNGACFQSFCSDWNKGFCIFDKTLLTTIKPV